MGSTFDGMQWAVAALFPLRPQLNYSWSRRSDVLELAIALSVRLVSGDPNINSADTYHRIAFSDQMFDVVLKMYEGWWEARRADLLMHALLSIAAASEWLWDEDGKVMDLLEMCDEVRRACFADEDEGEGPVGLGARIVGGERLADEGASAFVSRAWDPAGQCPASSSSSASVDSSVNSRSSGGRCYISPWHFSTAGVRRAVENALGSHVTKLAIGDRSLKVVFSEGDYGDGPFEGALFYYRGVVPGTDPDAGAPESPVLVMLNETLGETHTYAGPLAKFPTSDAALDEVLSSNDWTKRPLEDADVAHFARTRTAPPPLFPPLPPLPPPRPTPSRRMLPTIADPYVKHSSPYRA